MKNFNKGLFAIILIVLVAGWVLAGWLYFKPESHSSIQEANNELVSWNGKNTETQLESGNQIIIKSKIALTPAEIEQVIESVDEYMNEYKLPKGVQNVYTISIEESNSAAMKIVFNPEEKQAAANNILYARKTNNKWAVDANAGPRCPTLKAFIEDSCY
jgi:hypothetical protein